MIGAQERTRTSTPLRELAPEASASANSATWAKDLANHSHQNPTMQFSDSHHVGLIAQAVRGEP